MSSVNTAIINSSTYANHRDSLQDSCRRRRIECGRISAQTFRFQYTFAFNMHAQTHMNTEKTNQNSFSRRDLFLFSFLLFLCFIFSLSLVSFFCASSRWSIVNALICLCYEMWKSMNVFRVWALTYASNEFSCENSQMNERMKWNEREAAAAKNQRQSARAS